MQSSLNPLRSRFRQGAALGVLGFALASVTAHAQEAPSVDAGEEDVIVVTGSRIARPEIEAPTPIAVVSSAEIQQDAAVNVQDILTEMPQVGIGTTRTNSNFLTGANGVATVNLRNLDEDRTLVLVNGRRFIAGLAGSSAVDINNIPTDFVERIEVVTGGQSAVYGSEAIAGVVNFILKDKFEGISVRGQAGLTSRSDNPRYMMSITGGTSFGADDRGSVLLNFTYDKDEGLFSRKRGISDQDCFLNASPDECGPDFYSSYAAQGRFELLDAAGERNDAFGGGLFTFDPSNNLVEGFPSGSGYNRNAARRISVPVERYLASGIFNYELTDNIRAYSEVTYSKVKSSSQIEATPLDYTDIYTDGQGIPITNPFIPAAVQAAIAARNSDGDPTNDVTSLGFRRRQVEVFTRSNTNDRDTWRAVVGLDGSITDKWNFDVSYVYGHMRDLTLSQDIDNARYRNALDAIELDGQIVCRSASARAEGCVPINLFGYNTASPEASAYVQAVVPKSEEITNKQHVVTAAISGTPFSLPAGDVGVAFGAEYRKESSVDDLDILTNTGGNSGNQIPDTRGSYDVWEGFAELSIPILRDKPFFEELTVNGAARYSDYSTVGNVFSWNAGLEWEPVRGFRFRGGYAVANRAPNISELFSAPSETFPSDVNDPCIGVSATSFNPGTTTAALAAACRALPGFANNIAGSPDGSFFYELADIQGINGFDGGNINLNEETAKTITLGAVWTPPQVRGLSVSVDYFDIKIEDAIGLVERDVTVRECLESGDPAFCNNVIRSAATGRLQTINAQLINVADIKTRGIDVAVRYSAPIGLRPDDRFDFSLLYTYLLKLEKTPFPGADTEEYRGQLDGEGRQGAGFKHKASGRLAYTAGPVTLSWQVNYLGKIVDTIGGYGDAALDRLNSVPAQWYHDVQLRWAVGEKRDFEFYVGADNLFDNNAPFLPSGFASNITGTETAADTYDPFGRRFYAGFRANF